MSKRRAVSIVIVVLMVGSAAWGSILQGQGFAIGTDNMIHLTQGDQSGQSSQNLLIDMSQNTEGNGLGMVSASAYGVTHQNSGMGAFGLLGAGTHVVSAAGLGGIVAPAPVVAVPGAAMPGAAGLLLAQARLNTLVH